MLGNAIGSIHRPIAHAIDTSYMAGLGCAGLGTARSIDRLIEQRSPQQRPPTPTPIAHPSAASAIAWVWVFRMGAYATPAIPHAHTDWSMHPHTTHKHTERRTAAGGGCEGWARVDCEGARSGRHSIVRPSQWAGLDKHHAGATPRAFVCGQQSAGGSMEVWLSSDAGVGDRWIVLGGLGERLNPIEPPTPTPNPRQTQP